MEQKNDTLIHTVTPATMADFLSFESGNGASANTVRRLSCAVRSLYDYLTDDKVVTRDALVGWRKSMEDAPRRTEMAARICFCAFQKASATVDKSTISVYNGKDF